MKDPAYSHHLAELRKKAGLSQRAAAAQLGISQALLSNYERALREPGLDFICRACDFYGVSADWLLGRTARDDAQALKQLAASLRELAEIAESDK